MPLSMEFEIRDGYLETRIAGVWRLDEVKEAVQAVRDKGRETGQDRLLVDMHDVTGRPSDLHRFQAAEATAEAARGHFRVALISPQELSDRFFEDAARNRGAAIKAFQDRDEALTWLFAESNR